MQRSSAMVSCTARAGTSGRGDYDAAGKRGVAAGPSDLCQRPRTQRVTRLCLFAQGEVRHEADHGAVVYAVWRRGQGWKLGRRSARSYPMWRPYTRPLRAWEGYVRPTRRTRGAVSCWGSYCCGNEGGRGGMARCGDAGQSCKAEDKGGGGAGRGRWRRDQRSRGGERPQCSVLQPHVFALFCLCPACLQSVRHRS